MARRPRILLIEDEPSARRALRMVLEFEGYRVRETTSADEALETWKTFSPDAIVTDTRMPGKSPLEAVKLMRELRSSIPVIVFSGNVNEELRELGRKLCFHVILKPNLSQVLEALSKEGILGSH